MTNQFAKFYPVLPNITWIERLAPLGIEVVQLRLKNTSPNEIDRQIKASLEVCKRYGVQLIVNDYWQAAIRLEANYIHLGQEDLAAADVPTIKAHGLKLGISTHSIEELDNALKAEPDYIALGPIYETVLKKMKWAPQGLETITTWETKISQPLIAIGGINLERTPGVFQAGADSVAVVTDLVTAKNPEQQAKKWLKLTAQY